MIQGTYQVKPPLPFTPGFELSGEVVEVGPGVEGIEPGQKVMAQCDTGAFAEYVVVPYVTVRPVPEGMTMHQAAAFPLVYQTSYFGLAYRGQLRPDESVLVHSAAGGVGLAAVQIARAMGAGKIIGTAGSEAKLQAILDNGADEAIDYETQDFVPLVTQATEGRGADVIYDPVGGQIGQRSTKCIAFEGRIVIVGFTSGEFTDFRSNHILIKNYSVVGLHWGFYRQMNPAKIEQGWHELMQLYAGGGLTPHIGGTYPMENVAQAMKHLLARKAVGKLVLHW
jgi:NADPH2:quinone reductase